MNAIAASSPRSASACWHISAFALAAATLLVLSGCAGMSARETSTVVGATAGAVVGGVVTGSTAGAAVGAAAGGVIGNELSKKRHR